MGQLVDLISKMVSRQVAERGLVVWYDPQRTYSALVQRLQWPGVTLLRLEDGFFRLRERLEPFLEYVTEEGDLKEDADRPPNVVVYVPEGREDSAYALIEAETAGVVMEPGAARPECNTRLGALVERVFETVAPTKAAHLARQADEGLLSLEELDRMAEDAGSSATGALQVVFGQASVEEILLKFMASDAWDRSIDEKKALGELAALVRDELGLEGSGYDSAVSLRAALRRYVLLGDLLLQIPGPEMPEPLSCLPLPQRPAERDLIRHLCGVWRNRTDFKESFIESADAEERANGLAGVALPLPHLQKAETFPVLERRWLDHAALRLLEGDARAAEEVAHARLPLFWARERAQFQMEWKVIEAAAEVCREAARIQEDLKGRKWSLDEMVQAYACHAEPWMRLDRAVRHLEARYAWPDVLDDGAKGLDKAVALARQRYADAVQVMAAAYSHAARDAEFTSQRFGRQSSVFKDAVRPRLEKGTKVAFLLVDGLRFEMGADLAEGLGAEYEGRIEPILGQLPGITAVGMAALLPGAELGMALEKKGAGLAVAVSGRPVSSRQARMDWLQEKAGVPVAVMRLGEAVKISPKRKKEIEAAHLIVVTSQEIDRLGEEVGELEEMRGYIDEVLEKLRRAVRALASVGVREFVISADHGFHLVEGMDPGLAMDSPGGETVKLHPRVWIGKGGGCGDGYLRLKASDLKMGGELEFAFPRGLGTFKVKGGVGAYFHGGISPQEHILPLLTAKAAKARAKEKSDIRIKLSMAKSKITNRLFTITIEPEAEGLFPSTERRLRLDVISGKAQVGSAVAAGYGFEEGTREVKVQPGKPNVVTLMIQTADAPNAVTVQVMDSETQLVLGALKDIPVDLGL